MFRQSDTLNNGSCRKILIPINLSKKSQDKVEEYGLREHFFDPSKSSPPNNFMAKLEYRMSQYYSNQSPSLSPNK